MKKIIYTFLIVFSFAILGACTDLEEKMYSSIGSEGFIHTKEDILSLALAPYDQAYASIKMVFEVQENMGDHWATYTRNGTTWYNNGKGLRTHQHTWTWDDDYVSVWNAPWRGIILINNTLDILDKINPEDYSMDRQVFNNLYWSNRTLRAWFYIRLFDFYRNIPIYRSVEDNSKNIENQASPQETFSFIEQELIDALAKLPKKESLGGNKENQQRWNKAGAAALLVRLYLNSEKWTGVSRYDKCAEYAQKIIDGEYGPYAIDDEWDEPFKWNNDTSDELIYAFASDLNYSNYHYSSDVYFWTLSPGGTTTNYFLFSKKGNSSTKFALTPSMDVDGVEYSYDLGKPVTKFKKYPSDYRLKLYKNLGNGEREGMFLFGKIPNLLQGGFLKQGNKVDDVILRDQAGFFNDAPEGAIIDDKRSGILYADDNSGWRAVKYPFYPDTDGDKAYATDYAEIRLAEIYYSLAECKLRGGDVMAAGDLLNVVRKRNYPAVDYPTSLYQGTVDPKGNVTLDMNEMLDEWGREFLGEFRRRTDLCRFNRFTEAWWDKPQSESFREILPISRTTLAANPNLKQNPGYDSY